MSFFHADAFFSSLRKNSHYGQGQVIKAGVATLWTHILYIHYNLAGVNWSIVLLHKIATLPIFDWLTQHLEQAGILVTIWAPSIENVPLNMRDMFRFKSSWACTLYHPDLCCPFIHSVLSNGSVSGQWRPWPNCECVLALCLTLSGSNYPCLEQISMVQKTFKSLKFDRTSFIKYTKD